MSDMSHRIHTLEESGTNSLVGEQSLIVSNLLSPDSSGQPPLHWKFNSSSLASPLKSKSSVCYNCGTDQTSLWRKDDNGHSVCNACRLFYKLHGRNRPQSMKKEIVRRRARKRNMTSPIRCGNLESIHNHKNLEIIIPSSMKNGRFDASDSFTRPGSMTMQHSTPFSNGSLASAEIPQVTVNPLESFERSISAFPDCMPSQLCLFSPVTNDRCEPESSPMSPIAQILPTPPTNPPALDIQRPHSSPTTGDQSDPSSYQHDTSSVDSLSLRRQSTIQLGNSFEGFI